jgi:hypothetical protein
MIAHRSNTLASGEAEQKVTPDQDRIARSLYTRMREAGMPMSLDEIRTRLVACAFTGVAPKAFETFLLCAYCTRCN